MSGDFPLFSIVVPTFNRRDHIGTCLASIVAQDFTDKEVVLVDNCSSDDTVAVAKASSQGLSLRTFTNADNYERAYSRNRGAVEARGRYLLFLDSDDLLQPGALRKAADFIAEDPTRRFFFQILRVVDETGRTLYQPKVGRGPMSRVLVEGNPLSCSGVYVERDLFLRHRFEESPELVASEDWHCWIRIAAEELPLVCPGVGALLVDHSGRTMTLDPWDEAEQRFEFLTSDLLRRPEVAEFLAPNRRLFQATQDHFVAVKAAGQGALGTSVARFFRAVLHYPRLLVTRRTLHLIRLWLRRLSGRLG